MRDGAAADAREHGRARTDQGHDARAGRHGRALPQTPPLGDPTPSVDDVALTERLQQAEPLMDIEVLDHLILADTRYRSFKATGRL